jgi:phage terminase large subunit-like protein
VESEAFLMSDDEIEKRRQRELIKLLEKKAALELDLCFDPLRPGSRPTKTQLRIATDIRTVRQRFVLGGNQSGKSAFGAWECARIFQNKHDNVWPNRPQRPLVLMVIGINHKNVLNSLWLKKIEPFLKKGEYKIKWDGSYLSSVTHQNGNQILFFSHNSPEECRKNTQGYVADWVWLDEMPGSHRLVNELVMRAMANNAPMLFTFTPLVRNADIKNHVETIKRPMGAKYFLNTYENPVYTKDQLELMREEHKLMSDAERATRISGAWYAGDSAVYDFSQEEHVEEPPNYSPQWRHVEAIDPANSGKTGHALIAENPATGTWYLVREFYYKDKSPTELIESAKNSIYGFNIVKRVSDTNPWFTKEAHRHSLWYEIPHRKSQRKADLIKGLQDSLHKGKLKIAPWCKGAIDEFTTCQWAEGGSTDRIVNSKHYHLLDCLQYGVDKLPPPEAVVEEKTFYQIMRDKHRERVDNKSAPGCPGLFNDEDGYGRAANTLLPAAAVWA